MTVTQSTNFELVSGGNVRPRSQAKFVPPKARPRLGAALVMVGAAGLIALGVYLALMVQVTSHVSVTASSFALKTDSQTYVWLVLFGAVVAGIMASWGIGLINPKSLLSAKPIPVLTGLIAALVMLFVGVGAASVSTLTYQKWGAEHGISNITLPANVSHAETTLNVLNDKNQPIKVTFRIIDDANYTITLPGAK